MLKGHLKKLRLISTSITIIQAYSTMPPSGHVTILLLFYNLGSSYSNFKTGRSFLIWVEFFFECFIIFQSQFLQLLTARVSSETCFTSKQPKLEPKLVSALSETKHLVRLFSFFTNTSSFIVLIEPKQKKTNRNKPK